MTDTPKPYTLHHGDTLAVLRGMADHSVDAIVTDPPYGLKFMGRKWDADVPAAEVWAEALRVLKPGGHLLCFAGTRTHHRMATRIEEGGFELRDMIAWVYGSGFPKSLDVGKAIDKAAGAERAVVGTRKLTGKARILSGGNFNGSYADEYRGSAKDYKDVYEETAPATEAAAQWQGWGTALKPALEPITVARKPFAGTVANNVLAHGTGGINVDACRVMGEPSPSIDRRASGAKSGKGASCLHSNQRVKEGLPPFNKSLEKYIADRPGEALGRFPANFIHDGSPEVLAGFPDTGPSNAAARGDYVDMRGGNYAGAQGKKLVGPVALRGHDDAGGSAARFFYCAKASASERDAGLQDHDPAPSNTFGQFAGTPDHAPKNDSNKRRNTHETVKPLKLMRYLVRLVTPPGGTVLDAYCGSGTTGAACMHEGFKFVGIDSDPRSIALSQARIAHAHTQATQATAAAAPKP